MDARFWPKVKKSDGCWEWQATKRRGYGSFAIKHAVFMMAHRVAYELTHGPIPEGMYLCHHCDNRVCVRPDHMFVGTNSDNQQDAKRKGRLKPNKFAQVTHCVRGHPYSGDNLLRSKKGRLCRACYRDVYAPRQKARRAALGAA